MIHAIVSHPVVQVSEITSRECEVLRSLPYVLLGICILIETVEMSCTIQSAKYLTAMATASKSHIHIDATRTDIQTVNTLVEQNWYMIHLLLVTNFCLFTN